MTAITDTELIARQAAEIEHLRAQVERQEERYHRLQRTALIERQEHDQVRHTLWGMYGREHRERIRLLHANERLTGKLLRRARTIGRLRSQLREALAARGAESLRMP